MDKPRKTLFISPQSMTEYAVAEEKSHYGIAEAAALQRSSVLSLKGILRSPVQPVSIEGMRAAIAAHGVVTR